MNARKNAGCTRSLRLCLIPVVFCGLLLVSWSQAIASDILIKLAWTAEAGVYSSDLDLYVTEPNGEVCSASNPSTSLGGQLDGSDTGPEYYLLGTGVGGDYKIAVKYPGYDTENPQDASVMVVLDEGGNVIDFGSETLGETVGSTWYVGTFKYPGGEITSQGADIIIKLAWTAQAGLYTSISDLDLYVTEPGGETASPSNATTSLGGELDASETGPEFYQTEEGEEGDYTIAVKYPGYDTDNPQEATVTVTFYKGSDDETVITFGPAALGQTVGSTWDVGGFNFPGGTATYEGEIGTGCFIATAAYGSALADEVSTLRAFRDKYLQKNRTGKLFLSVYYSLSPRIAHFTQSHHFLRALVRSGLKPVSFFARLLAGET